MADRVEEKYCCPVCCDVLKLPVVTPCRHLFCTECLHESIRRNPDTCPVCRSTIKWSKCTKNTKLAKEIDSVTLSCQYCGKTKIPLLLFNNHILSCPKKPALNPNFTPIAQTSQAIPNPGPNRATFSCPICQQPNLDCSDLVEHCNSVHKSKKVQAVCPICASMPWGNPDQSSNDFIYHLNLRHKFEYDTYVDFHQDEDSVLKAAIEASLEDN